MCIGVLTQEPENGVCWLCKLKGALELSGATPKPKYKEYPSDVASSLLTDWSTAPEYPYSNKF